MTDNKIMIVLSTPWVGSILGIFGLILAIFFYFRSKNVAKLFCHVAEFSVVGGANARFPDDIEISFSGKRVKRVTSSTLIFWNGGNTTVDISQVATQDPLVIKIVGGEILKMELTRRTREVNAVSFKQILENKSSAEIKFEFLDPFDGFSAVILHSGSSNSLKISGTIKGIPRGIIQVMENNKLNWIKIYGTMNRSFAIKGIFYLTFAMGMVLFIMGFSKEFREFMKPIFVSNMFSSDRSGSQDINWQYIIAGLCYSFLPGLVIWNSRRRYPASLQETFSNRRVQSKISTMLYIAWRRLLRF